MSEAWRDGTESATVSSLPDDGPLAEKLAAARRTHALVFARKKDAQRHVLLEADRAFVARRRLGIWRIDALRLRRRVRDDGRLH